MKPFVVGIVLFDEIEVLDFCGPFEVFSVTRVQDDTVFKVVTISEKSPITTRGGMSVNAHFTLDAAPQLDILLVPGGQGTRKEMHNTALVRWIAERAEDAEIVASVCSGALLLAKGGLLDGLKATTHHLALDLLRETAPETELCPGERFTDNGKVLTSAGISAGIDMSLHIVGRLFGPETAANTASHMEYRT